MSKKISDLPSIDISQIESGMEIEIEQENVSYRVSLAQLLAYMSVHFMAASKESVLMPKAGGTFTGTVAAKDENPTTAFATRNIKGTASDPGAGSALATGRVLVVYDE